MTIMMIRMRNHDNQDDQNEERNKTQNPAPAALAPPRLTGELKE